MIDRDYDPPRVHCDECPASVTVTDLEHSRVGDSQGDWQTKAIVTGFKVSAKHLCPICSKIDGGHHHCSDDEVRAGFVVALAAIKAFKWENDGDDELHYKCSRAWHAMRWAQLNHDAKWAAKKTS